MSFLGGWIWCRAVKRTISFLPVGPNKLDPYTPRAMANAAASHSTSTQQKPAPDELSHMVNPAGTFPKGVLRWGYFLVLNAIAAVIAVALFLGIFYADGLDHYMRGIYDWLLAHPGITSLMAFSPLAASLLVGFGYSQRARKRKAAAEAAAAKAREHAAAQASAAE